MWNDIIQISRVIRKICKQAENRPVCLLGNTYGSRYAKQIIDDIENYGCWCYFEDQYKNGRGKALNSVDRSCKNQKWQMLIKIWSILLFPALRYETIKRTP